MSYLLYKEAEPDQGAINRIGGAVGGGALGYLMTRYGLGIKGVGAGLTGAGVGATLGSVAGGYLADHGKTQTKQKRADELQKLKIKDRVDESVFDTARRHLRPGMSWGAGGTAAGYFGVNAKSAIDADLESAAKNLDTKVRGAAGDTALEDKLLKKNPDPDLISTAREKLKGKNTTKERDLYRRLSTNATEKGTTSFKRKAFSRMKRGGKAGIIAYLLSAGALTGYERLGENPRREAFLKGEGDK